MKKAYLPDTATARQEAILTARELLAEAIRLVPDVPDAFVIMDQGGELPILCHWQQFPRTHEDLRPPPISTMPRGPKGDGQTGACRPELTARRVAFLSQSKFSLTWRLSGARVQRKIPPQPARGWG
jgi:hypothetical protein